MPEKKSAKMFSKPYLCPSSCVIVCASVMPLSSLTLQDLSARHMPPTLATPSVEQPALEQMFCLVTRMATSWCCGSSSFFGFSARCHLSFGKVERFQCCANGRKVISTCRNFRAWRSQRWSRSGLGMRLLLPAELF